MLRFRMSGSLLLLCLFVCVVWTEMTLCNLVVFIVQPSCDFLLVYRVGWCNVNFLHLYLGSAKTPAIVIDGFCGLPQ
jgi:hypothetical protein